MTKISLSSTEKLRFNSKIENIFLNEILPNESLITDESQLSDFVSLFDISRSKGRHEDGMYLFEIRFSKNINSNEFETKTVKEEGTNEKYTIIKRVYEIFGVDISEQFNLTFPLLFQYLQKNMSKEKKTCLGLIC